MNDTLKVASRIGAELGAAKAENEAMRILLRESYSELLVMKTEVGFRGKTLELIDRIDAFLSRQPEPTDTYTAVDMATAAAQGFRDGQAAVEQAADQDESKCCTPTEAELQLLNSGDYTAEELWGGREPSCPKCAKPAPAQDEREAALCKVIDFCRFVIKCVYRNGEYAPASTQEPREIEALLSVAATRPAQTAPQGKFRMGDLVKKSSGSEWVGRVVGWYSTEQTKEGYAVESSAHRNSVQIYPVTALEAVE